MVIPSDEQGQGHAERPKKSLCERSSIVCKCRPEHKARCVYHRQLIHKLHGVYRNVSGRLTVAFASAFGRTFERRVKRKTAGTNDQIAKECDEEDTIMAILPAVEHALERQPHEQ